jgi:uncharacterized membrane protein YfcA
VEIVLGFLIAMAIGLTGVGAGVITTPVLILFLGLPAREAVGTALAFGAIVKIVAAPMYVVRRQVNWRFLALMVAGGLPGVLLGTFLLQRLDTHLMLAALGFVILAAALINLRRFNPQERRTRTWVLPLVTLPIGAEVGFSSAGAGALGSLALMSLTSLATAQVVGTDLFFGLALSVVGGGVQVGLGNFNSVVLLRLLAGGAVGALLGAHMATRVPSRPLRVALALWLATLGVRLCWVGLHG